MTVNFTIEDQFFDVTVEEEATNVVVTPEIDSVIVISAKGPPGEPGEPGPAFEGVAWWYGSGPPGTIVGSKVGDYYFDISTGNIYKLGE